MVAMLRGVNVGGSGVLPMADLRTIATSLGFDNVRTYIQSGNLIFESMSRSTDRVATRLASAIAAATALEPEVIVRTRAELGEVIERSPFRGMCDDDRHLHVTFLITPATQAIGEMDLRAYAPEEAVAVDRELYLHLPTGIGRSKLAAALVRRIGPTGTTRNWRTVTKLLHLAT